MSVDGYSSILSLRSNLQCYLVELCSLIRSLLLGIYPLCDDLLLFGGRARLKGHLERIWLDDKKRVGFVQRRVDLESGCRVYLLLEVERPQKTTTGKESFVLCEGHAEALSLTITKTGHALDCWILREWFLERRPTRLDPALRSEVLWVWILCRIAEKCP